MRALRAWLARHERLVHATLDFGAACVIGVGGAWIIVEGLSK